MSSQLFMKIIQLSVLTVDGFMAASVESSQRYTKLVALLN